MPFVGVGIPLTSFGTIYGGAELVLTIDNETPAIGDTVTLTATWLGMASETPVDAVFYVDIDGGGEVQIGGLETWAPVSNDLVATCTFTVTEQYEPLYQNLVFFFEQDGVDPTILTDEHDDHTAAIQTGDKSWSVPYDSTDMAFATDDNYVIAFTYIVDELVTGGGSKSRGLVTNYDDLGATRTVDILQLGSAPNHRVIFNGDGFSGVQVNLTTDLACNVGDELRVMCFRDKDAAKARIVVRNLTQAVEDEQEYTSQTGDSTNETDDWNIGRRYLNSYDGWSYVDPAMPPPRIYNIGFWKYATGEAPSLGLVNWLAADDRDYAALAAYVDVPVLGAEMAAPAEPAPYAIAWGALTGDVTDHIAQVVQTSFYPATVTASDADVVSSVLWEERPQGKRALNFFHICSTLTSHASDQSGGYKMPLFVNGEEEVRAAAQTFFERLAYVATANGEVPTDLLDYIVMDYEFSGIATPELVVAAHRAAIIANTYWDTTPDPVTGATWESELLVLQPTFDTTLVNASTGNGDDLETWRHWYHNKVWASMERAIYDEAVSAGFTDVVMTQYNAVGIDIEYKTQQGHGVLEYDTGLMNGATAYASRIQYGQIVGGNLGIQSLDGVNLIGTHPFMAFLMDYRGAAGAVLSGSTLQPWIAHRSYVTDYETTNYWEENIWHLYLLGALLVQQWGPATQDDLDDLEAILVALRTAASGAVLTPLEVVQPWWNSDLVWTAAQIGATADVLYRVTVKRVIPDDTDAITIGVYKSGVWQEDITVLSGQNGVTWTDSTDAVNGASEVTFHWSHPAVTDLVADPDLSTWTLVGSAALIDEGANDRLNSSVAGDMVKSPAITVTFGETYTATVWLKDASAVAKIMILDATSGDAYVDAVTRGMTDVTDNWNRYDHTFTAPSTSIKIGIGHQGGVCDVSIWGAELYLGEIGRPVETADLPPGWLGKGDWNARPTGYVSDFVAYQAWRIDESTGAGMTTGQMYNVQPYHVTYGFPGFNASRLTRAWDITQDGEAECLRAHANTDNDGHYLIIPTPFLISGNVYRLRMKVQVVSGASGVTDGFAIQEDEGSTFLGGYDNTTGGLGYSTDGTWVDVDTQFTMPGTSDDDQILIRLMSGTSLTFAGVGDNANDLIYVTNVTFEDLTTPQNGLLYHEAGLWSNGYGVEVRTEDEAETPKRYETYITDNIHNGQELRFATLNVEQDWEARTHELVSWMRHKFPRVRLIVETPADDMDAEANWDEWAHTDGTVVFRNLTSANRTPEMFAYYMARGYYLEDTYGHFYIPMVQPGEDPALADPTDYEEALDVIKHGSGGTMMWNADLPYELSIDGTAQEKLDVADILEDYRDFLFESRPSGSNIWYTPVLGSGRPTPVGGSEWLGDRMIAEAVYKGMGVPPVGYDWTESPDEADDKIDFDVIREGDETGAYWSASKISDMRQFAADGTGAETKSTYRSSISSLGTSLNSRLTATLTESATLHSTYTGLVTTAYSAALLAFLQDLERARILSEITYMLPMLGADETEVIIPVVDRNAWGNATNNGFTSFAEGTGLDPGTHYLALPFDIDDIGADGLAAVSVLTVGTAANQMMAGANTSGNTARLWLYKRSGGAVEGHIGTNYVNIPTMVAGPYIIYRRASNDAVAVSDTTKATSASGVTQAASSDVVYLGCRNNNGSADFNFDGDLGVFLMMESNTNLTDEMVLKLSRIMRKYEEAITRL